MWLFILASILAKGLPITAFLWAMVFTMILCEYGLFPLRALPLPRPFFRGLVVRFGRVTIGLGIQYA